jgi:anti-anti-sigma factor
MDEARTTPRCFSISSRRTDEGIRLSVHGEIDLGTAGQLNRAIADALHSDAPAVLVDLSATTVCDCTGIAALLTGRDAALAEHIGYQVVNPNGISLKVIRLVGLEKLLTTPTS